MFSLINRDRCNISDDSNLIDGHTRIVMNSEIRQALQDRLGRTIPDELWQILVDHHGFTVDSVPIPCCPQVNRPSMDDRMLPDRWIDNLYVRGNYTVGNDGTHHESWSYYGGLKHPWRTPLLMLPIGCHGDRDELLLSLRPESFGKVFIKFWDDDPNLSEFFPQPETGQEVDPIVACQEVAPSLEAFFRGLTSVSDEEYEEWLKISY